MTIPLPPTKPRSNGLGIAAFIISLLGIPTLGLLSPVALLLSLIALLRRPRGFAFAGFVLGLLGTAFIAAIITIFGWGILKIVQFGKPMIVTDAAIENAHKKIDVFQATHAHQFPDALTGNALISSDPDGWNRPLHYIPKGFGYEIRSNGEDGVPGTEDDLSRSYP